MKRVSYIITALSLMLASSCKIDGLKLQKNYEYKPGKTVDANINKTALQYLKDRGKTPVIPNDTVFKYMQLGLEYAGFDLSEYEKSGRTFIFLSNNAIRVLPTTSATVNGVTVVTTTSKVPIAGMWFDFPIMEKNPDGTQKFAADGVTPVSHPATSWSEYNPQTLRNYFLYLIGQGELGFSNLINANQSLTSILPANTAATKESRMGYLVVNSAQTFNASGTRVIAYDYTGTTGRGFDTESKFNLKQTNGDFSPVVMNDNTNVATAGIVATNGLIHVNATTTYPSRY